mmetsp:Transcript_128939/g.223669  ORF Transcript_128939/g.223669 Transcript_128939/m.223669 type:complete len:91 (+) Transcript_128939:1842-2114(+)
MASSAYQNLQARLRVPLCRALQVGRLASKMQMLTEMDISLRRKLQPGSKPFRSPLQSMTKCDCGPTKTMTTTTTTDNDDNDKEEEEGKIW